MRRRFGKLIDHLAKKDKKIILLVGDIGYGIFDDFRKNHPKRFFNLGICEQSLIGVASGLGYGDNFIAVLTTSCANEMKRLLQLLDPKERTISQPAYLGDLLVTCYSLHSRNRSLGVLIGKGYSVENAIEKMTMVAEAILRLSPFTPG